MPRSHAATTPARRGAGTKPRHLAPARPRPARKDPPVATAQQVADLAWAGQHAKAIELATAALAASGLDTAARLDLLDLRAESYIAQGDLGRASEDAAAMLGLAKTAKTAAATAQALNRRALVQMRQGELKAARPPRRPPSKPPARASRSRSLRSACFGWPKRSFAGARTRRRSERDRGGRTVPGSGRSRPVTGERCGESPRRTATSDLPPNRTGRRAMPSRCAGAAVTCTARATRSTGSSFTRRILRSR